MVRVAVPENDADLVLQGTRDIAVRPASDRARVLPARVEGYQPAMLDELAATEGVARFLAVLKTRNFRSMALLRSLGFAEAGPGDAALATVEPDETLMHRAATLAAAPR